MTTETTRLTEQEVKDLRAAIELLPWTDERRDQVRAMIESLGPLDEKIRFRVDIHSCIGHVREEVEPVAAEVDRRGGRSDELRGPAYTVHHYAHHFAQARTAWLRGELGVVGDFFDLYTAPLIELDELWSDPYADGEE